MTAPSELRIYTASKVKHARRWQLMRQAGWHVVSTWIDEAEEGQTSDWADLWERCISEARKADILLAYAEQGEVLKGGLVEVGAALSHGVQVLAVGPVQGSWVKHPLVSQVADLPAAMMVLGEILLESDKRRERARRAPTGDGS